MEVLYGVVTHTGELAAYEYTRELLFICTSHRQQYIMLDSEELLVNRACADLEEPSSSTVVSRLHLKRGRTT